MILDWHKRNLSTTGVPQFYERTLRHQASLKDMHGQRKEEDKTICHINLNFKART
jgi:hypothetical protein